MYNNLQIFQLASGQALHASARQSVIAQNIANVDTPNYRSLDIAPFKPELSSGEGGLRQRVSREKHFLSGGGLRPGAPEEQRAITAQPNGNSVSLEAELVKSAELRQKHQMSVSVYKSAMEIIRTSIRR
jgi:flagellar basal-body rod protein FlgB